MPKNQKRFSELNLDADAVADLQHILKNGYVRVMRNDLKEIVGILANKKGQAYLDKLGIGMVDLADMKVSPGEDNSLFAQIDYRNHTHFTTVGNFLQVVGAGGMDFLEHAQSIPHFTVTEVAGQEYVQKRAATRDRSEGLK